jgi:hypothetical protein
MVGSSMLTRLAIRSDAGPVGSARAAGVRAASRTGASTRTAHGDDAEFSFLEPYCSYQVARPSPEQGSIRSITWRKARRPDKDADDCRGRACVRVVAHHCPAFGSRDWAVAPVAPVARSRQRERGCGLVCFTTRRRRTGWPPVVHEIQRALIELCSTIVRPPTDGTERHEHQGDQERHHDGAEIRAKRPAQS